MPFQGQYILCRLARIHVHDASANRILRININIQQHPFPAVPPPPATRAAKNTAADPGCEERSPVLLV